MDFLERLFSRGGKEEYLDGTWTTIYPTDAVERNLLNGNKESVFISVDKVAKAVAAVRFKVMRFGARSSVRTGPRP